MWRGCSIIAITLPQDTQVRLSREICQEPFTTSTVVFFLQQNFRYSENVFALAAEIVVLQWFNFNPPRHLVWFRTAPLARRHSHPHPHPQSIIPLLCHLPQGHDPLIYYSLYLSFPNYCAFLFYGIPAMQIYSMLTNHKYSEILSCLLVICAYDSELPLLAFLKLLPFLWPLLVPLCCWHCPAHTCCFIHWHILCYFLCLPFNVTLNILWNSLPWTRNLCVLLTIF